MLLPFYEHARREAGLKPPPVLAGCESCLKSTKQFERQSWACHREPPAPQHIAVRPWDHTGRPKDPGEQPVCAGYVCRLPEVRETDRAYLHWEHGSLRDFCEPNEHILTGIEVLHGSINAFKAWSLEQKK